MNALIFVIVSLIIYLASVFIVHKLIKNFYIELGDEPNCFDILICVCPFINTAFMILMPLINLIVKIDLKIIAKKFFNIK